MMRNEKKIWMMREHQQLHIHHIQTLQMFIDIKNNNLLHPQQNDQQQQQHKHSLNDMIWKELDL